MAARLVGPALSGPPVRAGVAALSALALLIAATVLAAGVWITTATAAAAACATATGPAGVGTGPWQDPVPGARRTARFGQRGELWSSGRHTGLDFAAPTGTPVLAVAGGTVISAGDGGPYGNLLKIEHGAGLQSWYAHLSAFTVAPGDSVTPGQPVGAVGATGNVTGAHLHLEARRDGAAVDPDLYLSAGPALPDPRGPRPPDAATSAQDAVLAARAARAAGFPRDELVTAVAVAAAESSWTPTATNLNDDGTTDYGLWQINSIHTSLLDAHDWRDPAGNARMAHALWRESGWSPWVAHDTGRYLAYLDVARMAVAQLGDGDTPTAPGGPGDPNAAAQLVDFGCDPGEASGGGHPTDTIPCTAGADGGIESGPDGVPIRVCSTGGFVVDTTLAPKLAQLLEAARSAGLRLGGGAYRSHTAQIELRRAHCGPSQYDIWEKAASSCSPPTAIPGQSMHEWGLAIDFTSNGQLIRSRADPAYRWLAVNAATYGLNNLPSEPWHWSTNGR